jgi:predicted metal-dependent peptidase
MDKWNISTDLAVNSMLVRNNFKLPSAGLVPNHYDEYTFKQDFFGKCITIKKISEKPAEEIYDELPDLQEQDGFSGCGGFDKHNEDDGDSEGKGKRKLTPAEIQEIEEKWKERLEEALLNSKMKGEVPLGMERLFDNIRKSVIPWRILLERVYSKAVPTDVNWLRRSKKSYACKIYLPNIIKEKVEVVNIIDTSGSISQDDLEVYISEIIGMARAYQNHIDMRIITHDCEVQDDYSIKNGNIEKIKALKIKGGGGTSHKPVFEYIKEKYKDTKIIISFTDGYSDLDDIDFNDYNFDKVFVIKNGSEEQLNNKKCKIININEK